MTEVAKYSKSAAFNRVLDSMFVCKGCGKKGFPCQCVATCDLCGFLYSTLKGGKCSHRVHQFDVEVERALREGYWRIDEHSGRLYKTRSSSKQHIYRELENGNVFFSRKEFNDLTRENKE